MHQQEPQDRGRAVSSLDVQMLQTAASLENLAAAACHQATAVASVSRGYPALATFAARSEAQHAAHAAAFNAAAKKAGGAAQDDADPRYAASVHAELDDIADPAAVASILGSLADVSAQSYTRYAALASSRAVRSLFVSVSVDEAAQRSFLLAALQLLTAGPADLVRFPTSADQLPAVIGTECFPHVFYPTADASAIDEGAVQ